MSDYLLKLVSGCEGRSIYLEDFRIAGPKPWGGGKVLKEYGVRRADLERALKLPSGHLQSSEPRSLDDWHEDDGPVLWWRFPVEEPPYSGTPLDTDWPGYHTHWTPLPPVPAQPGGG